MAAEGLASAYFPDQESFLKALAQPLVIQTPLQVCWRIREQLAAIPHALQPTKQPVGVQALVSPNASIMQVVLETLFGQLRSQGSTLAELQFKVDQP